ncbi:MAG: bestrophin family ion channel [Vicinamibacterales bacterium]
MIVRDHLPLRRVWPSVSKRLGLLFAFDLTVAVLYVKGGLTELALSSLPIGMMGAALSIFLAFRNNSAYDRWWEARMLWGSLVNDSRTFSRQALTLVDGDPDDEEATELVKWQIAYVHALRCHLRGQNPFPELAARLPAALVTWLRGHQNVPHALLLHAGRRLRRLYELGRLDSYRFVQLDSTLSRLCDVQGACERIKNTPLPRQYDYFPRMLVSAYCLLLPFGLVEGMGLLTPLASTLVSFIFLVLESIGRDIEAPFENTVHDTPMSALSRTIEINLRQVMGDRRAPREVGPIDGFVY